MALVFQFKQGSTVLVDLADVTKYKLVGWTPQLGQDVARVPEQIGLHLVANSINALHDNFVTLHRALLAAKATAQIIADGGPYTPVYLRYQWNGATTLVQSEVLDANPEALQKYFTALLQHFAVQNVTFSFARRPYFEETSVQALATNASANNNGASVALSGGRGDMLGPLYTKARTSIANQNRIIVGIKWRGTVTNFVSKYEAEAYNARGANVADLTGGATFSGAAMNAQRWTPSGATTLQRLLLWNITTNVSDQAGVHAVYARVKDNTATPGKNRVRARAAVYDGTNYGYGDYCDASKPCVTANGTLELVYCGVVVLPPVEMGNTTPNGFALELLGECDAGAGTLDIDCVYLIPQEGVGMYAGGGVATMTKAAGTGALPDMVLDASDRVSIGYLETTAGAVLSPANDIRGDGVFLLPNTTASLFVLTQNATTGAHDYTATNTVTVNLTPRYQVARGS